MRSFSFNMYFSKCGDKSHHLISDSAEDGVLLILLNLDRPVLMKGLLPIYSTRTGR